MAEAAYENQAHLVNDQHPQYRYLAGRLSHSSVFEPKTFAWSPSKISKMENLTNPGRQPSRSTHLRPHQARYLARKLFKSQHDGGDTRPVYRRWLPARVEESEGRDLAAGGIEHEEREAERQALQDLQLAEGAYGSGRDEETAQLYRLGLLYDDEHERGSGFTLDAITHDGAPTYTLHIRRPRRARRRGHPVSSPTLSYADVANDEALAAFLAEADYVDIRGQDLYTPREGGEVADAVRLQHQLWAAFRGGHGSDADEGEWEVV